MAEASHDHYGILGVTRNAKPEEIRRAYDRLRARMREEAAPPDARRVVLLQNAYDVLCDEARRAAYDESLRNAPRGPGGRRRAWIAAAAGAAIVVATAVYLGERSHAPPPRSATEILAAVSVAVGRVHAVDMSGRATPLGLAFATAPGRLLMACASLAPNAELVVRIGRRDVPARAADVSGAHGYCSLSAPQTGSWPLDVAPAAPADGDAVYATRVGESGEVALLEGRVRHIERDARRAVLELSGDASGAERGAPLLDLQGRVVAICEGDGHAVAIPARAVSSGSHRAREGMTKT